MCSAMAGDEGLSEGGRTRRCPRCEVCGVAVRVRGVGYEEVWCSGCMGSALPFAGLLSEREFRGALREYREGLGSRAGEFEGLRLDPFDEDVRGMLGYTDATLRDCSYMGGEDIAGNMRKMALEGGCSLSLLFHNIRSAKGPGLELLDAEVRRWGVKWEVIGLAETWHDQESEKGMALSGYKAVCASRTVRCGGGVALLIKDGLVFRERPDIAVFEEGKFESIFVEIIREGGRKNEVIGVVYRPPGGAVDSFNEIMSGVLGNIRGLDGYIMGDFNVDLLKHGFHGPTSDFMGGFAASGFYPLVSLPTRITDTSATLIDNIWTNNLTARKMSGLVTVRISDHLPAIVIVGNGYDIREERGSLGKKRLVNDHRMRKFAERLEAWSFDEVRAQGVKANVATFRNEFRDMYDEAFPWVDKRKNKRDAEKPWLDDDDFKELVAEKAGLYKKKLRRAISEGEQERLTELCKLVNKMRIKLKKEYFNKELCEKIGDLKATWETLNEVIRGRKSRHGGSECMYFSKDGVGITDGKSIAEGFCDFYCNVGPKLAAKIPKDRKHSFKDFLGDKVVDSLFLSPTTPREVEELCAALEPGKGMGWDGISPRVIKRVARELSGSLSRLLNCCMREGYYPDSFKVARVVPVFKSEDPTEFSNYRPVSVLPVLNQIFERVIKSRLVSFLDKHQAIVPAQYGFRAEHSTAMAVLDMAEKVRRAWSKGNKAIGVLIDLKKAFDTVDHDLLLAKLEHYGIRGQANMLVASYLSQRYQYVSYAGFDSGRGAVECGVPQGSVLGPLFFILYVNDMVRACPELGLVLFADDTNIFAEDRDVRQLFKKVNEGLARLDIWFRCNKLTLNLKKTEYMFFAGPGSRVQHQEQLLIGGEVIKQVSGARFLGVWVDDGLKWTGQIDKVKTKIGQLLGVMTRASGALEGRTLLQLYNGLVLPHLQYCLMVWGDFVGCRNLTAAAALLRYQKRFVNLIAGQTGRLHSDPLFAKHKILKVGDLYRHQLRCHAWRFWHGKLPTNQSSMLDKVSSTHSHATRAANMGICAAGKDHCSVSYRLPKEWSSIDEDLRKVKSLNAFKKRSKGSFLEGYKAFKCREMGCGVCWGAGLR